MEYGLALIVLIALVALVVLGPLWRPGELERRDAARRAELEAAKEAKYREIRDAELDHRMGKLSDADWRTTDRELRAEAVEILRALDQLH
jgi:flagellar biosynthesis/type III secretory pathway M-ring protein FliF/YscJ